MDCHWRIFGEDKIDNERNIRLAAFQNICYLNIEYEDLV